MGKLVGIDRRGREETLCSGQHHAGGTQGADGGGTGRGWQMLEGEPQGASCFFTGFQGPLISRARSWTLLGSSQEHLRSIWPPNQALPFGRITPA